MAFGTTSRFRFLSRLLAVLWALLPVLSAAQCVHALPKPQAAARPVPSQTAPRCPLCAKMAMAGMPNMQMPNMQMPNIQMPGMSGMKCCCHGGNATMSCRCGVQPALKPAAVLSALVWSPHALLPALVRVRPPASSGCIYPGVSVPLPTLPRTPLPRPPRFL